MNTFRKFQRGAAIMTLIGGLIIAVLFIYLLYLLVTSGAKIAPEDASDTAVNGRIQSLGMVKVSDGIPPGSRTGEEVFKKVCFQCHAVDATIATSPKVGNAAEWGPRIAQGYDTLIHNAINGLRAMPPRGGASDLTDDELARAIAYMANQSSAHFTPPPVEGEAAASEPAASEPAASEPAASEAAQ